MEQRLVESANVRGFPLLQSILLLFAVVLAGVPVYRLTRPARTEVVAQTIRPNVTDSEATARATAVDVEAVFAPAPADFQLKNLGQTVLAGRGPKVRFAARWTGVVPPDGADLVVEAHWPAAGTDAGVVPAAAKFTVRLPDGRIVEKSFWADANGTLTDVLTVPGIAQPIDTR